MCIYIVGEGKRAREVGKNGRFKHEQIRQIVDHLKAKHPNVDKKIVYWLSEH